MPKAQFLKQLLTQLHTKSVVQPEKYIFFVFFSFFIHTNYIFEFVYEEQSRWVNTENFYKNIDSFKT